MLSLRDKMKGSKMSLGRLLLEVFLIVLGVLMALGVNEWRQANADKQRADMALRQIENELQYNLSEVMRVLPQHQVVLDSLRALARLFQDNPELVTYGRLRKAVPGLTYPLLQVTSWELAKETEMINHIDYDLAAELSKVYGHQAFYQSKLDGIGTNWYEASNHDPERPLALGVAFLSLLNDIVIQEKRLRDLYPSVLEQLSNQGR